MAWKKMNEVKLSLAFLMSSLLIGESKQSLFISVEQNQSYSSGEKKRKEKKNPHYHIYDLKQDSLTGLH